VTVPEPDDREGSPAVVATLKWTAVKPGSRRRTTSLERAADTWIRAYKDAEHLRRTRDWALRLEPEARLAVRLAALTHDMERHFEGGPTMDPASMEPDDVHYLQAHTDRSSAIVASWLREQGASPELVALVADLVRHHELGGSPAADLVQAADSLSFLETKRSVMQRWLEGGRCDLARAERQPVWMAERIRLPAARPLAEPLLAQTLDLIRRTAASIEREARAR
jgi:hypothetical protein